MMDKKIILDSHTHRSRPGVVVNLDPVATPPRDLVLADDRYYSVGIHPWNAGCYTRRDLGTLRRLAASPRVVAIGETGLDMVHVSYVWVPKGKSREIVQAHPDLKVQMELLMHHIELSEHVGKPLVLHIVKLFPEIIRLRKKLKPTQPWIIHGYRGKSGLAKDLLKCGFYLSYGEYFNPQSVKVTPPSRMLAETDESRMPIEEIIAALPVTPGVSLPDLWPGHCAEDPQV
ncbi:MAG: TatD family hydrolase [Duncaniella sp.]|nr:TatD family hydrolase [Duncaniella sp.]